MSSFHEFILRGVSDVLPLQPSPPEQEPMATWVSISLPPLLGDGKVGEIQSKISPYLKGI